MKSRISSKGQVTIPAAVRRALGLVSGMPVEFVVREGEAVMRKGRLGMHPVDAVYGTLDVSRPVDVLIEEMRGPGPTGSRRVPTGKGGRQRRPRARR